MRLSLSYRTNFVNKEWKQYKNTILHFMKILVRLAEVFL